MTKYPKIPSVYKRDPENPKNFLEGQWSTYELRSLKDVIWLGTEKIDGTNIRIHWDGEEVHIAGRNDESQIPADLLGYLRKEFPAEKMKEVFGTFGGLTLYGEGFGGNIQKAGKRYGDLNFILFDILGERDNIWFTMADLMLAATNLNTMIAPLIFTGPLEEAIEKVKTGIPSYVAQDKDFIAEGLVLRPEGMFKDRNNQPILTKVKTKDFE